MPKISVVCPVFNEVENIPELVRRVSKTLDHIIDFELIFAVDPSTDGTEALIRELNHEDSRIKMIRFSRRFGQPTATLAGIHFAKGDAVVVIDADLQDPPEVIAEMVEHWQSGSKIVLAQRDSRTGEPAVKKAVASIGYSFLNRFAEVPIPRDTGDFRLLDRQVVDELKKFPETHGFLRGLVALVGFETTNVTFARPERFAGNTNYNKWLGSLKIGFNGVVGFSTALLSLSTVVGFFFSLIAVLVALGYVAAKIAGVDFPLGNPTIVIAVLLLGGFNLVSVGILGMYVSRIYDEVKQRPKFIVSEKVGL